MQKILLLSLNNRFLERRGEFAPPVQIGCRNSPVYIGLTKRIKRAVSFGLSKDVFTPDVKQPKFDVIDNLQKVANFASGCLPSLTQNFC